MKTLRQQAKEKLAAAESLRKKATDEGRAMSEEETAQFDGFLADHDRFQADADREDGLTARLAAIKESTGGPPNITIHERFQDDPMFGFKNARHFLQSVIEAGRGKRAPDNLRALTAGSDEQGGYSDAYGGYFVPEQIVAGLKVTTPEGDPTVGRTQDVPMNAPVVRMNARVDRNHSSSVSGGLRVYRRAETDTIAASRMQFEQVTLEANELMGIAYATNEILNDSVISLTAILERGFRDEFSAKVIREKISGTGTGQFMGVLISDALITVAKESMQAADTINFMNLLKMRARAWGYGNAIWLYNHDALVQLATIKDDMGNLIWLPSARDGEPDRILGRPAIGTDWLPTLGDLGDILLCNWGEYLEGTYQGIQNASSVHVRFVEHETAFKFWLRNAGAPWWRTAFTPPISTVTRSPYVALAARA